MRGSCDWHDGCYIVNMRFNKKKLIRLFQIKTRAEVFLITYALALGSVKRGQEYLVTYPGNMGWVFFALTTGAVFLASAKMLEAVEYRKTYGPDE
jgi:hypothetical protein